MWSVAHCVDPANASQGLLLCGGPGGVHVWEGKLGRWQVFDTGGKATCVTMVHLPMVGDVDGLLWCADTQLEPVKLDLSPGVGSGPCVAVTTSAEPRHNTAM